MGEADANYAASPSDAECDRAPPEQAALPYVDYRTSNYRLPPVEIYRRGPAPKPPLAHFILLSMLFHALIVLTFGAPSGGSREGRAMWGSLNVVLLGPPPDPAPTLKLDRALPALKGTPSPRKPARAPEARTEPAAPVAPSLRSEPVLAPKEEPFAFPPLLDRIVAPEVKPQAPPLRVPLPTEKPYVPTPLPDPVPAPRVAEPPAPPAPPPVVATPPAELPRIETPIIPALPAAPPAAPAVERPPPVEVPALPVPAPPVTPPPVEVPALPIPQTPAATPPPRVEPIATPPERTIVPEIPVTPTPAPAPAVAPERPAPRRVEPEVPRRIEPGLAPRTPLAPSTSPLTTPAPGGTPRDDRRDPSSSTYDPTAAPTLDLDAMRKRAGQLAREGTGNRAALPFPMPPMPERKTKEQIAIEKARKPDCRTAYKDLGLLAIAPLIANEFGEGTCRW